MSESPGATPKVELDPFGFPMVWVEEVHAYVHWLPVTKIQFEILLCHSRDQRFDGRWYEHSCRGNRRVSPKDVEAENYWGTFLTGVLPEEALAVSEWCGSSYRLPSLEDWLEAYRALKEKSWPRMDWSRWTGGRVLSLLNELGQLAREEMSYPFEDGPGGGDHAENPADEMFFRMGVIEWVTAHEASGGWCGMGELHPGFGHHISCLDQGFPIEPRDLQQRHGTFGFRLFRGPRVGPSKKQYKSGT